MGRVVVAVIAGMVAAVPAAVTSLGEGATERGPGRCPRRVVSMAPHVTETLFALDAGGLVVGVDTFSREIPAAAALPRLGSYVDADLEALVALRPDLVIAAATDARLAEHLARFGIRAVAAPDLRMEDVFRTIDVVGAAVCREPEAAALARSVRAEIGARVERAVRGKAPRTVLVVDRTPDDLRQIFVAGPDNFLNDLLEAAGAENAFAGAPVPFPQVSLEPIVAADPDLVIELLPGGDAAAAHARVEAWARIAPDLRAVRTGSIRVLTDRAIPVPGPGVARSVGTLAEIVDAARAIAGSAP